MHWRLEEEAQEALDAVTAGTGCKVAQQTEVEQQWCCKDRVAAEEVDLDLHWVTHPAEDVDVVPALLVVVARWIIVDAYLMIILGVLVVAVAVEVWLLLWLLLITLFLAWYPFGDYACVYSFDSWRFAYVVVVPLASLAAGGFTLLWHKSRKLRLVACFLAMLALTPYFLKTASFDSPMQTDYELFLQNAVQTAAYNGVPLVLPDSHLFCPVVYRLGGQAYVVEGLVDYDSRKLKKWRSSWPEDCRIMVVCLYQDKTDNYNLELWDGWKVNLLSQEPITGTGLFLLQKDF